MLHKKVLQLLVTVKQTYFYVVQAKILCSKMAYSGACPSINGTNVKYIPKFLNNGFQYGQNGSNCSLAFDNAMK